jgi:16S rRNA (cytosine967-C5)-methyltransferase
LELTSSPSAPGLAARKAALAILSDVLRRKVPLDAAAASALSLANLPPRDAAFARAVATETLRRFGQLETLLRHFIAKMPPPHKAGSTIEILLAGACELVMLKVAAHAAVDAANRLAQADAHAVHFKGLINAVLRRVAREGSEIIAQQDACRLNTPDWLWPRWIAHYGEETARAIAKAHLAIPPLDLTCKSAEAEEISGSILLAPGHLRVHHAGRVEDLAGFREGRWWVQDFAASLPTRLCGEISGQTVIDLCAAPGGKTAQLAAAGARVMAIDISGERLSRIGENLARLNLPAKLVTADARDWRPPELARVVLLDAPCTATGTIRRHPDLPWLKSAADLVACEMLQSELLDSAAEMVEEGGMLIYAVCSLEPEEGEEQIEALLRRNKHFRRVPIAPGEVFDAAFVSAKGDLKTLPCHWADKGGMDGFYAARLKRYSSLPSA